MNWLRGRVSSVSINLKTHQWAEQRGFCSFYSPSLSSTNDVAKREFSGLGQPFALYLADHQTQGRGRGSKKWRNLPHGESLLSTWCFQIKAPPQPIMTPLLGLALYQSLLGLNPSMALGLKAPNDIYLAQAKLGGLLVEVEQKASDSVVLVGLGLNVTAAPQVDIPTICLKDKWPSFQEHWFSFCENLYDRFLMALKKGCQTELSPEDQEALLKALNAPLPGDQHYLKVSPRCDLQRPQGFIPWQDL